MLKAIGWKMFRFVPIKIYRHTDIPKYTHIFRDRDINMRLVPHPS